MKLIYGVKDKPKAGQLVLFAFQQLLAILAALSLCMAGDIVIQYRFVTGAVLFFAANLVFFSYQIWSLHELGLKLKNVI